MGAWARRSGLHRVTVERIKLMDRRVIHGPAFLRLSRLIESMKSGQWTWIRTGPRLKAQAWTWEGQAEFEQHERPQLQVRMPQGGTGPGLSWA